MNELGNIRIADDVVKTIAAKAAGDVEGVYKLAGGVVDEVSKMLGKKRPTNGLKVVEVNVYVQDVKIRTEGTSEEEEDTEEGL